MNAIKTKHHNKAHFLILMAWCLTTLLPAGIFAHPQDEYPSIELTLTLKENHIQLDTLMPYSTFADLVASELPANQIDAELLAIDRKQQTDAILVKPITEFFQQKQLVTIDQIQVPPIYHDLRIYWPAGQTDPDTPEALEVSEIAGDQKSQNGQNGKAASESQAKSEADLLQDAKLELSIRYSVKNQYARMSLRWGTYLPMLYPDDYKPGPDDPLTDSVSLMINSQLAGKRKIRFHQMSLKEPMYTWHNFSQAGLDQDNQLLSAKPYEQEFWRIQLLKYPMLVLAACCFLITLFIWRRKIEAPQTGQVRIYAAFSLAFTLIALLNIFGILPGHELAIAKPGQPEFKIPEDKDASAIFSRLHANIYRAFDYSEDSAIYDTLAQSCDGPVLERIYRQVYQSLVMAEEGGAIAKVQNVKILTTEVSQTPNEAVSDPIQYTVTCKWRVRGAVRHFGHTHERLNEFQAAYTLAPRKLERMPESKTASTEKADTVNWRIVAFDILDEQPIELEATSGAATTDKQEKIPAPISSNDNPFDNGL